LSKIVSSVFNRYRFLPFFIHDSNITPGFCYVNSKASGLQYLLC
jgi:hypothetical protein